MDENLGFIIVILGSGILTVSTAFVLSYVDEKYFSLPSYFRRKEQQRHERNDPFGQYRGNDKTYRNQY